MARPEMNLPVEQYEQIQQTSQSPSARSRETARLVKRLSEEPSQPIQVTLTSTPVRSTVTGPLVKAPVVVQSRHKLAMSYQPPVHLVVTVHSAFLQMAVR